MTPAFRPHRALARPALALAFALAGGHALAAQQHPNHVQGFQAERVYQLGNLDSVNLFNGNLTVQVPLGGSYSTGGGFSYQLTLSYSGNVWESEAVEDPVTGNTVLMAVPRKASNAGLGWQVSLGALTGNYEYRSPDGAAHPLADRLHPSGPTANGFRYSTDSTYLRLNEGASPRVLELPDGTRRYFDGTGRLTRIDDRFNNWLKVELVASQWAGIDHWRLTDSQNREHWVYFKPAPAYAGVYNKGVVDRVVVKAFGGATSTYSFNYYGNPTPPAITRGLTDPSLSCQVGTTTVTVPLLASVTQPDGSTFDFTYDLGPYHSACVEGSGNLGNTTSTSGHLVHMGLPTGGALEWDWDYYFFPTKSEKLGHLTLLSQTFWGLRPLNRSVGVVERRMEEANGSLHGRWLYDHDLVGDTNVGDESRTTVTDPLNNQTTHYFSVYACQPGVTGCPTQNPDPVSGKSFDEYGLPFTRNTPDSSGTRFLSAEIRQGASNVLRRQYMRYESSGFGYNPRLASERTVYLDDGSRYADVDSSDFDGLGHYRRIETDGNFPSGSNERESYTSYNLGNCATCTPGTGSPWVLGTYTVQDVTEGGATARTETCFEAGTGFLSRTRTLKSGTTRGGADLISRYTKDASGNATAEESFGGDTQAVDTGGLCGLALPAAKYKVNHTYQSGSLASSQYQGQPFKSADFTIDASTGRVKTSRDTAGLATTYLYDAMGRLTDVRPAQDGWTQYAYFPYDPPSGNPAQVWIYRRPNGGGTPLTEEQIRFDGLGQVKLERRQMADGTFADRSTTYDGAGNLDSRTEWGTTAKTFYGGYDPFGRPATITPPDGAGHQVTLDSDGVRAVRRTADVGTAWNGSAVTESPATTTEVYDRQGRLFRVLERANPDGTQLDTRYFYDVGGRLRQVNQTGKDLVGASYTQTRLFTYDNRGFLTSERHPEKGAFGDGSVTYGSYDAGGHAGTRTDGPHTLRFTYDGAERLTQVEESLGSGLWRPLKSFTFGPAAGNGAGDWHLGKLQVARGYNYPVIGSTQYTAELRETYTYGGQQGRVSQRDTANWVNGGLFESFTQSWTWNDLGDPASITYPRCTHAECTAPAPRTVTPTYSHGFVAAVPGFASSITYHPNGQVNLVTHLNTPANAATWVTDTYTKDPYHLPRPRKIEARRGTTLLYSTGLYAYDGAGDVTKMGSSYYLYDATSRVVSGVQYLGPGGGTGAGGSAFSHSFDGFGNLQALTTTTSRSTPTSSSTNRLTGGATPSAVAYDAAGNLTSWNGNAYKFDALDQMWSFDNGSTEWLYLYTADGERIWAYDYAANTSRWTLRDLDGKVLREYGTAGGWHVERDYIHRGSQLLAAVTPTGTQHFHLDHLGTPRAVTNAAGNRIAYHAYFPFGEEASSPTQDAERMKFTGHERDLGNLGSAADDLDYMHARFYNPQVGRFLSTDPVDSAIPEAPQTWNKYVHTRGNPITFVDPDGREVRLPNTGAQQTVEAMKLMVPPAVRSAISTTQQGSQTLVTIDGAARSSDINFTNLRIAVNSPGIVQVNQTSPTDSIAFLENGTQKSVTLTSFNLKGLTLPTTGTDPNGTVASTTPGVMQIHVDSSLSPAKQAPVIAAELAGHVVPGLLGQGASAPDAKTHRAREQPAVNAARKNRVLPTP